MTTFGRAACCLVAGLDKTAEVQRKVLKDDGGASELTLKCHVEGNPEPTVIWTRNKQRYVTNQTTIPSISNALLVLSLHRPNRKWKTKDRGNDIY